MHYRSKEALVLPIVSQVSRSDEMLRLNSQISPVQTHSEKVSGKNTERPQLKKMLEYVREGDVLYIESISRLARSTRDLLALVQTLQEKKVELVSLKEHIDTATPQGRFVLTIFGALSELERENTLQRQREGVEAARMKGKRFGRPRIETPKDWHKVITLWKQGEITAVEAMKRLKINRGTFYRRVKELHFN